MKKFIVMALLVAVSAGAFASSLAVPWFWDAAPDDSGYPPSAGSSTYIALKNNTDEALVCQIIYYTGAGEQQEAVNTFEIAADSARSFRPAGTDGSEGSASVIGNADNAAGSAVVKFVGTETDVQGRLLQVEAAGDLAMYLLPTGI